MGTVRLGVFPSINNKITQDKLVDQVAKWFLGKFPTGFFHHIYIDTQNKNASQYIIDNNGEFTTYESGQKILQPNIRITVEEGANNIKDAFNGIYNVSMKPGAYEIETDLRGYKPIYEDCYGGIIAVNDYPIRNNMSIRINLQTKADQLAIANIINSNMKAGISGDIVVCDTVIPLPNLLMEYLRSCLFKPEITNLSKMSSKDPQYTTYKQEINKKFMEMMYRFSNGVIKPYKSGKNGDYDYVFGYERKQRVYVKLEEPDLDTGTKKGNVYDHFTVELSGTIDYANLISLITSVPAIIRGTKNNWYLKTSDNKDKNLYYSMMKFKEVYRENRFLEPVNDKYIHFYLEREVMMSSTEESFDLLDTILFEKQFPAHYHVMKALLSLIDSQEKFDQLFKVCIYKDRYLITDYEIDKNFHIKIHNCDLSVPYYIDIFLNKDVYYNYIDKMKDILDTYEINWNESNVNTNRGYTNDILYGFYKGKIIKDHNEIQLDPNYVGRDISKIYTSTNSNRGSIWNINFDGNNINENLYTPIKNNLYVIPDPNYAYFMKETENLKYDKPVLVKDGHITNFIKGRTYYYYNNLGDLIEVSGDNSLIVKKVPIETSYIKLTQEELDIGPIKTIVYYHKNSKNEYKQINSFLKTINFDNSKTYYYKNDDNEIIEVNKVRIFNKKETYYTYDISTEKYLQNVGLKTFEDGVDYYIKENENYIKVPYVIIYDKNITYYLKDEFTDSFTKVDPDIIFDPDVIYYKKVQKLKFNENYIYFYYKNDELKEVNINKTYSLNTKFYIYKSQEPDPDIFYYHYETDYIKDSYVKVSVENGFNINKDYYIVDSETKEYLKIDINKMLVPNPNFTYYIYDTNSQIFKKVKNISGFDPDIQYYTNIYDEDTGNIIISVKEKK